jgi:hypothetical protein
MSKKWDVGDGSWASFIWYFGIGQTGSFYPTADEHIYIADTNRLAIAALLKVEPRSVEDE